jgi:xanthine dehydrogenase small subunit
LVNKGKIQPSSWLSLHLIERLDHVHEEKDRIIVGALVTLETLRKFLKDKIPPFSQFLNLFASPQIKNMATLVGNVANGSPIADTLPFLMVNDGLAHISGDEDRKLPISDLYTDYKTLALKPEEIITHLSFAKPKANQILRLEKVSMRRDLDISTLNLGVMFEIEGPTVKSARIALGGVYSSVLRLIKTEALMQDKILNQALIDEANALIDKEISPITDLRGSKDYRRMLVRGLFQRICQGVMLNG